MTPWPGEGMVHPFKRDFTDVFILNLGRRIARHSQPMELEQK
jgi:hypothetical protein